MITLWIEQAFSFMINQSLLASWLILAVIVIRTCTNKMPKSLRYVLWVFVAVRLLSPISIESNWSLVPEIQLETKESTPDLHFDSVVVEDVEKTDLSGQQELYELQEIEEQEIEIPNQNVLNQDKSDIVVNAIKEKETSYTSGNTNDGILSMEDVISVGSWIWIIGIFTIGFSSLISVLCLKKKVDVSIQLNENLWVCDEIQSPFIYGLVSPRIYVPSFTTEEQLPSILAHENEHLKYHDHWWKPLGFAILTVHWFNPLIWIAYILFCRDMELACDERVIQHMNEEEKKQYSKSLLMCNNPRYIISACPLAFGEIGVKERIKSILNYRKPSSKIIGIGVFICIILAVCFMTNQKTITLNLDVEKIEKIELRSGMTGNSIEITEKEEILRITENINKMEFQRQGSTAGHGGWSYWLICYDVEGNEILSFTTVGDKRIAMDDYFYKCINGTLDKKYFAEILNEVSETEISTENIVAESGDEKLKTYLETQMGEALSEEEIQWFETEFFNTEENRMPNMFLTSDYDRPENINLNHLFYCGADGFGGGEISEEEKDLLYQRYTVPQLDFTRTTTDEMNVLLQKYMNISLEEANQLWLEYMYYLPEYNAYYKVVGDTKYSKYDIMAGWKNPDGTISLVYTDKLTSIVCYFEVTLQKDGNSYYFLSNIQLPEDLSVITTAKISEEEALRRTSDVDGQIYTTMINDQVGYTLRCSSPAASLMEKVLCKTSDGGNTYEEYLDISSMGNYPQGVYFFTEEIGYIITDYHGNFNFLYRTEDGGKTWTPQMIYIPGSWYSYINGLSIENGVLQIEVFVDEDAFYYAYTTDDMGETWKLSYGER